MGIDVISYATANSKLQGVPSKWIFTSISARDTYFATNPTELVDSIAVVTNKVYQERVGGAWVDITGIIKGDIGDAGEKGNDGFSIIFAKVDLPIETISISTEPGMTKLVIPNGYTIKIGDIILSQNGNYFNVNGIGITDNVIVAYMATMQAAGTTDYNDLSHKPKVNGVELQGNLSTTDIGINIPKSISELNNDSNYVNQTSLSAVDADQKNIVIEKTFDTASEIAVWLNLEGNIKRVRQGTILRTLNDDPDFLTELDVITGDWKATPIPNIHASKVDYNDTTTVKDKIDEVDTRIESEINALETDINTALSGKQDAEAGKSLSTNDFTDTDKSKLNGLENYNDTDVKTRLSSLEADPVTKTQVDTADANILASAKQYADNLALGGSSEIDLTNYATSASVDAKVATAKSEAISEAYTHTNEEATALAPKEYFVIDDNTVSNNRPTDLGNDISSIVPISTTESLLYEFTCDHSENLKINGTNSYTGKLVYNNLNPAFQYQFRFEHTINGNIIFNKQTPSFQPKRTFRADGFNVANNQTNDLIVTDGTPVFRIYGKVLSDVAGETPTLTLYVGNAQFPTRFVRNRPISELMAELVVNYRGKDIDGQEFADEIETETDLIGQAIYDIATANNIIDVVPNKSALDAYTQTGLKLNDIIVVSADETHSGAKSFYKWLKPAAVRTWVYQFSESIKQTKTDNSLTTTAKDIVPAINELNSGKVDRVATLSFTDFNNLITGGMYYSQAFNNTAPIANSPIPAEANAQRYSVLVIMSNPQRVQQFAILQQGNATNDGRMFTRSLIDTTWGTWRELAKADRVLQYYDIKSGSDLYNLTGGIYAIPGGAIPSSLLNQGVNSPISAGTLIINCINGYASTPTNSNFCYQQHTLYTITGEVYQRAIYSQGTAGTVIDNGWVTMTPHKYSSPSVTNFNLLVNSGNYYLLGLPSSFTNAPLLNGTGGTGYFINVQRFSSTAQVLQECTIYYSSSGIDRSRKFTRQQIDGVWYPWKEYSISQIYSTNETFTGSFWIDGKPIYRKVIDCGALPNTTAKAIPLGIANIDTIINYYGTSSSSTFQLQLPHVDFDGNSVTFVIQNKTSLILQTEKDRSAWTQTYVTVEYTKTV